MCACTARCPTHHPMEHLWIPVGDPPYADSPRKWPSICCSWVLRGRPLGLVQLLIDEDPANRIPPQGHASHILCIYSENHLETPSPHPHFGGNQWSIIYTEEHFTVNTPTSRCPYVPSPLLCSSLCFLL